ncbi:hypothetical protein [Micromonospora sp. NBC_00617]|uniref:hypothetical protein n=1 Tax=Micromonospora sp. NBC_00617 TaxID=2903587 RepID=UPI0030E46707
MSSAPGGVRAEAPVSAPPAVPAPALPSWPPSTAGTPATGGTGYRTTTPPGGPARRDAPVGPHAGRRDGGTDLAGTVYGGGEGPGFATVALPANAAVENSGSLTGHILAQGWSDTPTERSRNTRVVIVLIAALGLLVGISVLVVLLANDALDGLVGGVLNG